MKKTLALVQLEDAASAPLLGCKMEAKTLYASNCAELKIAEGGVYVKSPSGDECVIPWARIRLAKLK